MIKINSLNKYFNKGKQNEIHVINDISLELPSNGMVAIFGKSGCGKTTLLNTIGGLDNFKSGNISIDENDITNNTDNIRNKYIGYIFQNYNLNNNQSCFNNVADALKLCGITNEDVIKERVMASLKNVGMEKYYKRTPDSLSGGQQQRIAIARAIVKNPKIILADEPTGNLDENNTILIMNLLKAISKEHLVVLVTHEESLVNYYCNKIIHLSDGKVVNIEDNYNIENLNVKNKNNIYLGDLDKESIKNDLVEIDYYGEPSIEPINLKIINNDGKLYIKIDSPKIQILDHNSETKIKEGKFNQNNTKHNTEESIDMSNLPPIVGTKYGKLFNIKSSIKEGFNINFKKNKKGRKLLHICMALFSMIIVFMFAVFGTSIKTLKNIKNSYNHNVFYVYTENYDVANKINNSINNESGIDYTHLEYAYTPQSQYVSFSFGTFETFKISAYESGLYLNATILGTDLLDNYDLVIGRKDNIKTNEIVISTKTASILLEKSLLGHIKEYKDLLGLSCDNLDLFDITSTIVGIVKSDEPAIYINPLTLAKQINTINSKVKIGSDYNHVVKQNEITIGITEDTTNSLKLGDTISLHGKEFKVTNFHYYYSDYNSWLKYNYPNIYIGGKEIYIKNYIHDNYPNVLENTREWEDLYNELNDKLHYNYIEYFYQKIDEYLFDIVVKNFDIQAWIYVNKNIDEFKYIYIADGLNFYKANKYKELHNEYPYKSNTNALKDFPSYDDIISKYMNLYHEEAYYSNNLQINDITYFMNDNDYIEISKKYGYTDINLFGDYYEYYNIYTLIHSNNPTLTTKWIEDNFSDLYINEYTISYLTPNDTYSKLISEKKEEITINIISMLSIFVVMSICMYFIMKSSLMNRIKEIGIYRAIGASKKNIVFKFAVESFVLATLTITIGYLIASIFINICTTLTPIVKDLLYYPLPISILILFLLYSICILFGILPVINLLRKTPNEILSKYDI